MELNRGRFYLIGGGPAARTPGEDLMPRFINEAGGSQAKLTIITAGTEDPEEVNACYWNIFKGFGISNLFSPKIMNREEADASWVAEGIAGSNAVFIAGGSQAKLAERLGGTAAETAIIEVWKRGGILSGTSAGASVFAELMILDGGASNRHLRKDMIDVGRGFDIISKTAIDTHCSSRGRIPRMLSLLISHPALQVIGIDEDTALFIDSNGTAEVVGYNAVYVLDSNGSRHAHFDRFVSADHLCASAVTLHCLMKGDRYDLSKRACPQ